MLPSNLLAVRWLATFASFLLTLSFLYMYFASSPYAIDCYDLPRQDVVGPLVVMNDEGGSEDMRMNDEKKDADAMTGSASDETEAEVDIVLIDKVDQVDAMTWMKGKTVLVTGASGFIGCNLVRYLASEVPDATVVGVDLVGFGTLNGHPIVESENVRLARLDIRDRKSMQDLFNTFRFDVVYHLAERRDSLQRLYRRDIKVLGDELMRQIVRHGTPHLVFTSSMHVYAPTLDLVLKEGMKLKLDSSVHVQEKIWMERQVSNLELTNWTIFRLHDVFGPYQVITDGYSGGIHAANGYDLVQPTFVMDVVAALARAPGIPRMFSQIINLGASETWFLNEVEVSIEIYCKWRKISPLASRMIVRHDKDFFHGAIDHSLLESIYPFQNRSVSFNEALVDTLEWHHAHLASAKVAIVLEPRASPKLLTVIAHFFEKLSPAWTFRIYTSRNSRDKLLEQFELAMDSGLISVSATVEDHGTKTPLTHMLKQPEFYEEQIAEKMLFFQTDTVLCSGASSSIEEFLEYDFVGAPWEIGKGQFCFNGGLSLRRRTAMLKMITYNQQHNIFKHQNEDYFFCRIWRAMPSRSLRIPTFSIASRFSVESQFFERPVGIHKCWSALPPDKMQMLLSNCPEIRLIHDIPTNNSGIKKAT